MRILLTTPPMQHYNVSGIVFSSFGAYNLAKVAANLGSGHVIRIADYLLNRWRPHKLARDIREFSPDVVAISNPFSGYTDVVTDMARLVKSINPKAILVTGGQAPTYLWEKHIRGGFDYVVRYEGEDTFRELVRFLNEGQSDPASVEGLAYRDSDGNAQLTPERAARADLDTYPWAARHLAPVRRGILTPGKAGLMELSRGCPYHCSFCSQPNFWGKVRRRSNEAILDELAFLANNGYTEVCFTDDTVGVDHGAPGQFPEETAALMEGILSRGISIGLGCCMRADTAARYPDFIKLAAKAGLVLVNMGFESYTHGGVAEREKSTSRDINRKASEVLRENGVLIWGSHIYGAPTQTAEDMKVTRSLGPKYSDFFRMTMASPLPGSSAFERMFQEGKVDMDATTQVTYYHYAYKDGHDPATIQRNYMRDLMAYYLNPKTLATMVDNNPLKRAMARQSYKGAAFFGLHKALRSAGVSKM